MGTSDRRLDRFHVLPPHKRLGRFHRLFYVYFFIPLWCPLHFAVAKTVKFRPLSGRDWVNLVAFFTDNNFAEHAKTRQGLAGVGVRACTVLGYFDEKSVF